MTERRYRHHGLILTSNVPLTRLPPASGPDCDVSIEVLAAGRGVDSRLPWVMTDPPRTMWRARTHAGSMLRLRYGADEEWAEFVVDEHGTRLRASWSETVLLAEACELLLGPVFSCLLAQRGMTCLHAAVVELDGRVLALAGPAGTGKSSTAMALVQEGGTLVCDDAAVLTERDGRFAVPSGARRVRMRPDAARALVGSFDELAPMWVHEQRRPAKRYAEMESGDGARTGEHALDVVYLLAPRDATRRAPALRPLAAWEALPRLMAQRHMVDAIDRTAHQRDFARLARLAEAVAVRELLRPDGIAAIEPTVAAIAADARRVP